MSQKPDADVTAFLSRLDDPHPLDFEQTSRYRSMALALVQADRRDLAIKILSHLTQFPDTSQGPQPPILAADLALLGQSYLELGHFEESVRSLSQSLRVIPHSALALNNRGAALLQLGRFGDAEEDFREAIRVMPKFPPPYIGLAQVLISRGCSRMFGATGEEDESDEEVSEWIEAKKVCTMALVLVGEIPGGIPEAGTVPLRAILLRRRAYAGVMIEGDPVSDPRRDTVRSFELDPSWPQLREDLVAVAGMRRFMIEVFLPKVGEGLQEAQSEWQVFEKLKALVMEE